MHLFEWQSDPKRAHQGLRGQETLASHGRRRRCRGWHGSDGTLKKERGWKCYLGLINHLYNTNSKIHLTATDCASIWFLGGGLNPRTLFSFWRGGVSSVIYSIIYTDSKMHLSVADCVSVFRGFTPRPPAGLCPWNPLGVFCTPPSVPTLPPNSGCATDAYCFRCFFI